LRDFDFSAIARALAQFHISLSDLAAVAVAVFDHGNAPPNVSDRKFRFDYLDERIKAENRLSAFAYRSGKVPSIMTRLQAVVKSASEFDCPLIVMDTAPAAVLGARLEREVSARQRVLVVNVGNFHTLAFRLNGAHIEGVFEHHTGLLDRAKLETLIRALADGSLTREYVFNDSGHGSLIYAKQPLPIPEERWGVAVTGPRRAMMEESALKPYFPAPFGDMMLTGCFGMLGAVADLHPELADPIWASLKTGQNQGTPPWEIA
jgi:uncharacterized protein (DUF1786 family)